MRAGPFSVVLILMLPAILIVLPDGTGGTGPDEDTYVPTDAVSAIRDEDYNGWPTDTSKVDIIIEKPMYSGWNLTGNLSINATIVNRLDRDLNITVRGMGRYPYNGRPDEINLRDNNRDFVVILNRTSGEKLQFNISISSPRRCVAYSIRYYIYVVDNINRTLIGANHTDIVGLSPVSVKVTSPVLSGGSLRLRTNTAYSVTVEVTNYSNGTLEGTLESGYAGGKTLLLRPNTTERVVFSDRTPPDSLTFRMYYHFKSWTVSSYIGFDMAGDSATNVTAPLLHIEAIEFLRVGMIQPEIELAVPAEVNFSVLTMANKTLRDLRFEVSVHGWMSERVSHPGFFTIRELVPGVEFNTTYKVLSHVTGQFTVRIVTYVNGEKIQFKNYLSINSHIIITDRIVYREDRDPDWDRHTGDQISFIGYVKNLYPYTLRNVTVTIMMVSDIGGFLSREDFITVTPRALKIESLEPNQTVPFVFNVTYDSPGRYDLPIGVFWGGNATPGGDVGGTSSQVSRPSAIPSLSRIVPVIPLIAVIPKIIDALIRKWKKIGY